MCNLPRRERRDEEAVVGVPSRYRRPLVVVATYWRPFDIHLHDE